MDQQKQQLIDKVQAANNVLVTVSMNPTVDQLAACIGLTLVLNKMGKHATAVFSGAVPSTIDFLKPEETIEKTTDSLRDFIIAIDKSKADKLRYKVEDEVVKIFITPYRHSIGQDDLVFSQGDFNVDVVMALGVVRQQDVDTAITAHGRILHDAVVIGVSTNGAFELGAINWTEPAASGVSELVAALVADLGPDILDKQIATALLTGIVAETDHFGNKKTTPQTMTVSAALLAAGANQQLVAAQLEKAKAPAPVLPAAPKPQAQRANDGNLKIAHSEPDFDHPSDKPQGAMRAFSGNGDSFDAAVQSDYGALENDFSANPGSDDSLDAILHRETEQAETPATIPAIESLPETKTEEAAADSADTVTPPADATPEAEPAASEPEASSADDPAPEEATNELKLPAPAEDTETDAPSDSPTAHLPTINPLKPEPPVSSPLTPESAVPPTPTPLLEGQETLADLEEAVHSPHTADDPADVDSARKAVEDALNGAPDTGPADPRADLNAMPVNLNLGHVQTSGAEIGAAPAIALPDDPSAPEASPPIPGMMPDITSPPAFGTDAPMPGAASPTAPVFQPDTAAQPSAGQGLPDYLNTSAPAPQVFGPSAPVSAPAPQAFGPDPNVIAPQQPLNPATNEPAPLNNSPADQPVTMPLPPAGFGPQAPAAGPQMPGSAPQVFGPQPPAGPPPISPFGFNQ